MPKLLLGPLLRYVDETRATIWVQTDAPCVMRVSGDGFETVAADTFTVHGHHYALAVVTGLEPGGSYHYTVELDGERAWPEPDSDFPASRIRTIDPEQRRLRLLFGSCRTSVPHDVTHMMSHGVDILRSYAHRMAELPEHDWPSALLMLGDQVYADKPPPRMREFIEGRRDTSEPPGTEIADYAEYAELYRQAWSEPALRWLLSTVPTSMIFDDHDLRDDWNTSDAWQRTMRALPWWRRRVTAGLASYWIYQHLGNMSPEELADDPMWGKVVAAESDLSEPLDEFAWQSDADPESYRWSYTRDYGKNRVIMLDTRCARVLDPARRAMIDPAEWDWFERAATAGPVDHLIVASSLPVLLPRGLHEVESWNEAVCDGAWGRRAASAAEWIRQRIDLEHWAAFRTSFDAMSRLVTGIVRGQYGTAPASVLFLGGDVHFSYLAQARLRRTGAKVYQIVCSPIRNPLARTIRLANGIAAFAVAGVVGRALARSAGVRKPAFSWKLQGGPFFQNAIATLDTNGREVTLRYHTARITQGDPPALAALTERRLT
ncbi:alkaline phosphatase D family protein [Spongiactinospora sp. TRM90649]|uniref:alkaline phosphatase D family protein n=1 Tax=Spongiactinospora sp. TRM90649 TaxID=3031114 RepID=UPI0023F9DC37|nr:alkaline phosphatase D family protein [Spongiactinospora sp. TRM90649]MDF5751825.1 alkaline phosphatase D family protein [Spongiactinospora sp. TRM90649]